MRPQVFPRTPVTAIVVAAALSLAGCGGSGTGAGADEGSIDGSWKGTLKGSGNATFDGYVDIDTLREGSVSGTVYFPGVKGSGACSGALVFKGRDGEEYLFTEELVVRENPACVTVGRVRIASAQDGAAIEYSWKSGPNTAAGTLREWDD